MIDIRRRFGYNRDMRIQQMDDELIPSVVFDIDGTLADVRDYLHHLVHRPDSPRDWDRFHNEAMEAPVKKDVLALLDFHYSICNEMIILMTSRNEMYRDQTKYWLIKNNIPHHLLVMRSKGDRRPSEDVKQGKVEWLQTKYDMKHFYDDHPEVCERIENMGYNVTKIPGYEEDRLFMEKYKNAEA